MVEGPLFPAVAVAAVPPMVKLPLPATFMVIAVADERA
jgi:hypothetical protein